MFNFSHQSEVLVTLPTGVQHTPTHWKQTVLWLNPDNVSELDEGDTVTGTLRYTRMDNNKRDYEIFVMWTVPSSSTEHFQRFILAS
jgi:hypothetical protein